MAYTVLCNSPIIPHIIPLHYPHVIPLHYPHVIPLHYPHVIPSVAEESRHPAKSQSQDKNRGGRQRPPQIAPTYPHPTAASYR